MIATIPSNPLDIVGDIHGELDALHAVLAAAGYDGDGNQPDSRDLVFLGDLVDRGPDSPGVVLLVQSLIEQGRTSTNMGNHELHLLRGERKAGNDWFWCENTRHDQRYQPLEVADPPGDPGLLAFMASPLLALVRDDLRVVSAAWHGPSID